MDNSKNNIELMKINKEEIKYLPCIRLMELYDNCIKIKENNCNLLLISAIIKCGIS